MSIYSASTLSFNVGSGTPQWEVRTNATTRNSILEIGITALAATSIALGLGIPQARGTVLPGYNWPFVPEERTDPTQVSSTVICVAWQIAPTVPLQFFRRIFNVAGVGNGIIWTFARGLVIPINGSMVLWNNAAGPQLQTWIVSKE
jgi:hypothetical protein